MQKTNAGCEALTPHFGQGCQNMKWLPHVLPWVIALTFFTAPAPVYADAGPSESLAIALSSDIVASSVGIDDSARAVPGAIVDFFVTVTGPGESGSPATSFAVVDMVPKHLSLFVGDLAQTGAGPAVFTDNDSGLKFSFDSLDSAKDSIEFSSDGGKTFDYIPFADADGFDQTVTHIKLRLRGALLPTSGKYERFSIRYRMKVK
ncbi:hypothetical protein [Parasphingorhabdus sp.]|uniref:hypothetical protein n=1 Tax=Parasphingorhabdus sp. TaxID=2709688 RepID=UPI003265B092